MQIFGSGDANIWHDHLVEPEIFGGLSINQDSHQLLNLSGPAVVIGKTSQIEVLQVVTQVLLQASGQTVLAFALGEGQQTLELVGVSGAHAVLGLALLQGMGECEAGREPRWLQKILYDYKHLNE